MKIYLLIIFLGIVCFIFPQQVFTTQNFTLKNEVERSILVHFDTLLFESGTGVSELWSEQTINFFADGFDEEIKWAFQYPDYFPVTVLNLVSLKSENEELKVYELKFSITMNSDSVNNSVVSIYNVIGTYNMKNDEVFFDKATLYYLQNWRRIPYKNITYAIKRNDDFNKRQAKEQYQFIEDMERVFETKLDGNFLYISCENPVEVFKILGYDYLPQMYYSTSGGLNKVGGKNYRNIIYSGNSKEIYKHEFVHYFLDKYRCEKSTILAVEGIATYFGGSSDKSYNEYINQLRKDVELNKNSINGAEDLLFRDKKLYIESTFSTSTSYGIGALIAESLYEKNGLVLLKEFLCTEDKDMVSFLSKHFQVEDDQLIDELLHLLNSK